MNSSRTLKQIREGKVHGHGRPTRKHKGFFVLVDLVHSAGAELIYPRGEAIANMECGVAFPGAEIVRIFTEAEAADDFAMSDALDAAKSAIILSDVTRRYTHMIAWIPDAE